MTSTIAVIRHRVADFDAWKTVYDGFAPIQAEHGVHAHQVLRSIENPNDLVVTHTFESREAARAFFAMPELKEAMGAGGRRCRLCRDLLLRRGRGRRAGRRLVRSTASRVDYASVHGWILETPPFDENGARGRRGACRSSAHGTAPADRRVLRAPLREAARVHAHPDGPARVVPRGGLGRELPHGFHRWRQRRGRLRSARARRGPRVQTVDSSGPDGASSRLGAGVLPAQRHRALRQRSDRRACVELRCSAPRRS